MLAVAAVASAAFGLTTYWYNSSSSSTPSVEPHNKENDFRDCTAPAATSTSTTHDGGHRRDIEMQIMSELRSRVKPVAALDLAPPPPPAPAPASGAAGKDAPLLLRVTSPEDQMDLIDNLVRKLAHRRQTIDGSAQAHE
jgi:hypothetical protein